MKTILVCMLVLATWFRDCGGTEESSADTTGTVGANPRPGEADALPELRRALTEEVTTTLVDGAHWQLANRVIRSRVLVGKSREWIAEHLGVGVECGGTPNVCPFPDLTEDDRYFEVGRVPTDSVGGLPTIYLDFDDHDTCTAVRFRHTQ